MMRAAPLAVRALGVVAWLALVGCDESQVWHRPDPSTDRMQIQAKLVPYNQAMRPPPPGTVPRGATIDPLRRDGIAGGIYAKTVPLPVTRDLLEGGRASFERVCANCHGILGDGHSVVAEKMALRPPPSLHEARVKALVPGEIFAAISRGYGLMPSLAPILSEDERWGVVAYVEALQLSQSARVADLPPDMQRALAEEAK